MLSNSEKLKKLDRITTFDQLAKIATIDEICNSYRSTLKSRIYHLERNKKLYQLAMLAKKHGLDK